MLLSPDAAESNETDLGRPRRARSSESLPTVYPHNAK
jgi:hypothetical protein